MTVPDAATRLCAVLGHPVRHSISPALHNAALRHDGRNAVYLAFDVRPDGFEEAVRGLASLGAVGVNVTLPHKAAAVALADARGPEADRAGVANTLLFREDGITAHNTDVEGVILALEDTGVSPGGRTCLLLGAGGAGRAAAWALAGAGARLLLSNRTAERAATLRGELAAQGGQTEVIAWTEVEAALGDGIDVVVNATSVGLEGEGSPLGPRALERAAVGGCRLLLDLVYAPGETQLVRAARAAGLVARDGLGVLIHQAAAAYRLFWDAEPPLGTMRSAAVQAAGRAPRDSTTGQIPPIV